MSEEKKKIVHKKQRQLELYIFKVLKQVHPTTRISAKSTQQLNSFLCLLGTKISETALHFVKLYNQQTITSREIQNAVISIFPDQLKKHALSAGTRAVTKWNASPIHSEEEVALPKKSGPKSFGYKKGNKKPERAEHRAGITFSVARCRRLINMGVGGGCRIGKGGPIYLAAVLEYICAEMLELSGNAARDNKLETIKTRHLFLVVANDQEISELFNKYNIEFNGGGVIPKIRNEIIPRGDDTKKSKKKSNKDTSKKNENGVKKHRFRPGTVALREIRKQQKSTELNIQKAPFERVVREISNYHVERDRRFSSGSIEHLQGFVESSLVHIYNDALDIALYTKREGVTEKDIEFALKHSSMGFNKFFHFDHFNGNLDTKRKSTKTQISKEPLLRLARKAGIKRVSGKVYEISRLIIDEIIFSVLTQVNIIRCHLRMKTVTTQAVVSALSMLGFNYI